MITAFQRLQYRYRWLLIILLIFCQSSARADVYAQATAGQSVTVQPEYFGIHFHRLVLAPGEKAKQTEWPELQFGSVRLWDSGTRWGDIAPSAGQWNFERLDKYVNQASQHHAGILYTLGSPPRWASSRPDEFCPYGSGSCAMPVRIAHWEEYVRRVATRYKGQIAYYELWNEPTFSDIPRDRGTHSFFTGSVAEMVELARTARKVLDEVDPNAMLATPGFTNGPDRLEMFLAAGGKQYVQAVAYHFYSSSAQEFASQIVDVRAVMQRQGVANLPLWNTETGLEVYGPKEPLPPGRQRESHADMASRMAQFLVLGAAANVSRYYYFAWDNDLSGMVTRSGDHLPGYEAMAMMQKWLTGATLTGCSSSRDVVVICRGSQASRQFLIAWREGAASPEKTYAIDIPRGLHYASQEALRDEQSGTQPRVLNNKLLTALSLAPTLLWFDSGAIN